MVRITLEELLRVTIPHGGLGTKAVFEVYKWERESPSHPVGLELTQGVERDIAVRVSIPHGGLGTDLLLC